MRMSEAEAAIRADLPSRQWAAFDRLRAELVQAEICARDVLPGAHEPDVREQIAERFTAFKLDLLSRFAKPFPRVLPAPTPVGPATPAPKRRRGHVAVNSPTPDAGVPTDALGRNFTDTPGVVTGSLDEPTTARKHRRSR